MGWPGWHVPPLGLWNFHQPVKELKSTGKIFIKSPYDFSSEVRYTVNMNWLKKCATPVILPQIRLWLEWFQWAAYQFSHMMIWSCNYCSELCWWSHITAWYYGLIQSRAGPVMWEDLNKKGKLFQIIGRPIYFSIYFIVEREQSLSLSLSLAAQFILK